MGAGCAEGNGIAEGTGMVAPGAFPAAGWRATAAVAAAGCAGDCAVWLALVAVSSAAASFSPAGVGGTGRKTCLGAACKLRQANNRMAKVVFTIFSRWLLLV